MITYAVSFSPSKSRFRQGLFGVLVLALLCAPALSSRVTLAQESSAIAATAVGDMPTTGALRPGPMGDNPPLYRVKGVAPVAIKIDTAQVDSAVEQIEIVDGVMLDPSGPWIVSWYRETGRLGEVNNVVMSGHLDYWDVGPAIFWNLGDVVEGDVIKIVGEDGKDYYYAVEWIRNYTTADLTNDSIREIVGKTKNESLTLITCGGEFDYNRQEYLSRMVVRAHRTFDPAEA